jgi:hypothetical protein
VAATERGVTAAKPPRRRPRIGKLGWIVAGLGTLVVRSARAQSYVDSRLLFYKESDGRTQVIDPVFMLHDDFGDTRGQLDLILGYDSISGASPNGRYPTLDATTSASGHSSTSGQVPLSSYHDHRKALSASYGRRFGSQMPTVDVSYSKENDYTARSAGIADEWTMLEGRGTLHFGLSFASDIVAPVTNHLKLPKKEGGYSLGWTWILGERDLLDVSGSLMRLSGYLDDPYKVVPIAAPGAGVTLPEHRPDARSRYALVAKYGHHTSEDGVVKTTYRFYSDNWGIRAHTLEVEYDQRVGDGWVLAPLVRFYVQSKASFYGSLFVQPQQYMSADYRLSPFSSILGGLTVSHEIYPGLDAYVGATLQSQSGKDRAIPFSATGGGTSGQGVSSADMNVATITFGFKRRF